MPEVGPVSAMLPAQGSLQEPLRKVSEYLAEAKSRNTTRAYAADWRHFSQWCQAHGSASLPASPETVAAYVAAHAEKSKVSTLKRRLNAISFAHRSAGHPSPATHDGVKETMKGVRRVHGSGREGKAPLSSADVRAMVAALPESLSGKRDRALILLGFAGALRRSELVGLERDDVRTVTEGLVLRIRRSKTDQEGEGQVVGISWGADPATCPVRALTSWLAAATIEEGPIFRSVDRHGRSRKAPLSGFAVNLIVKRSAQLANVPLDAASLGAHSLRSGHATEAARSGAEERSIMRQGRWKAERTVRSYIRHGSLFTENSSERLGL